MAVLTIQRLEIFKTIYETGSLTQAGMELGLAQPTVSKHLGNFQRALKVDLFVNQKGRLRPTLEADLLYLECKGMFEKLEQIEQSVQSLQRGSGQVLRVMIIVQGTQLPLFSDAIKAVRDKWPEVRMVVSTGDRETQIRSLRRGEIDLGLGTPKLPYPDIKSQVLAQLEMVGVMPMNHALAEETKLPMSAFAHHPSVLPSDTTLYGKLILRTLDRLGVVPDTKISATAPMQLPLLVQSLECLSILDVITALNPPKAAELKVLPLEPPVHFDMCANSLEASTLSPQAEFLIQELRTALAKEKQTMEKTLKADSKCAKARS